jgi:hypothetical protein
VEKAGGAAMKRENEMAEGQASFVNNHPRSTPSIPVHIPLLSVIPSRTAHAPLEVFDFDFQLGVQPTHLLKSSTSTSSSAYSPRTS